MLWDEFAPRISRFSTEEREKIHTAFQFGEKAHAGQKRKSGDDFFTHPVAVSVTLIDMGADCDTVIAALLHDVVEDTETNLKEIKRLFGPKVAMLIDGVTKLMEEDLAEHPTLDQKIETLRKIFIQMQKDVRVMVIKLADRLHNMRTLSFRPAEKQLAVAKETMDVYVKIADRLSMRELRDALEEQCHAVIDVERYENMLELRKANATLAKKKIAEAEHALAEPLTVHNAKVEFEPKSWGRLSLQYDLERQSGEQPVEINAIFLCPDAASCYAMLGAIHARWPRIALTFDDFINVPAINGYRGVHTTVILSDGTRMRCKIRTPEMDEYAKKGIALQCFDLEAKGILDYLLWSRNLSTVTKDTKDRSDEFWQSLQSDVLSESMEVYSGTHSALIPTGATVLDAVLSLFPTEAFFVEQVFANGHPVSLSEPMQRAWRLDIVTSAEKTVRRDWLYLVQTGNGIAMVRAELAREHESNIAALGKSLLQESFSKHTGKYLEEFEHALLERSAMELGHETMDDAFVAIASRRLEPTDVIAKVQSARRISKNNENGHRKNRCICTFQVHQGVESLRRLLAVYDRYNIGIKDVRFMPTMSKAIRMRVRINLTPEEQDAYVQEIRAAGADHIRLSRANYDAWYLMGLVVVFWGINPVWASYFLRSGVSPFSLISVRSILFFFFSVMLYAAWRSVRRQTYAPIKNLPAIAVLPALSTFMLALFTYLSLYSLAPSLHLTILRLNVVLLPAAFALYRQKPFKNADRLAILLLAIIAIASFLIPSIPPVGMIFALFSLFAYILYSFISKQVQTTYKIGARYPSFLFFVGCYIGLTGLLFLPSAIREFSVWSAYANQLFLYVLLCVFLPHTCFHLALQRLRTADMSWIFLLEVPLAVLLEWLVLGITLSFPAYMLLLLSIVSTGLLIRYASAQRQSAME